MKKKLLASGLLLSALTLGACGAGNEATPSDEGGSISVGVTSGPHEDIAHLAADLAAEDGVEVEVVVFNDFVQPNEALSDGSLDLNSFQTRPFLEQAIADQGYDFEDLATTITLPMSIHSLEYESVDEIPDGASIGLPNSPTQEGRALHLFQEAGLITLPEDIGVEATVDDIVENPKNIDFVTSEPAQLPQQLPDLAAAAINGNFALDSGIGVTENVIYTEDEDMILFQANVIASRTENADDPAIATFIENYQSDEVVQFIEDEYEGAVIPAWTLE